MQRLRVWGFRLEGVFVDNLHQMWGLREGSRYLRYCDVRGKVRIGRPSVGELGDDRVVGNACVLITTVFAFLRVVCGILLIVVGRGITLSPRDRTAKLEPWGRWREWEGDTADVRLPLSLGRLVDHVCLPKYRSSTRSRSFHNHASMVSTPETGATTEIRSMEPLILMSTDWRVWRSSYWLSDEETESRKKTVRGSDSVMGRKRKWPRRKSRPRRPRS